MALKIRLRQQGRKNRQTYRLVVTDIRNPRDGKYLEMVGWYNPFDEKAGCQINIERLQYWVAQGATLSPNAETLLGKAAPDVAKTMTAQRQQKALKSAAKRRALRKA